jgi:hypothetical protein
MSSASLLANRGHFYSPHVKPVLIDCNFIVDIANGNGLGLRSLKGQGVKNVFMNSTAAFTGTSHTSTLIDGIASGTGSLVVGMPVQGSGIPALTNIASIVSSGSITLSAATTSSTTGSITYQAVGSPNPAAGIIAVQLGDNYMRYYGGFSGFSGPTATLSTSTVANVINVIAVLGTATYAQWIAVGMPPGETPAVGLAFIANQSAVIGGSAETILAAATGSLIDHIETVGDPNLGINPIPVGGSPNVGGWLFFRCYSETALTAPAAGSAIALSFYLGQSSVMVAGE